MITNILFCGGGFFGCWYIFFIINFYRCAEDEDEKSVKMWLQTNHYRYLPSFRNHRNIEILSRLRREFCIRVDGEEKIYTLIVDSAHQFDFVEKKE